MPHTRKHARRLLSELIPHLPERVARVLESPSYWDPGFCRLFFEYTEDLIFSDPRAGLEVAPMLPRLAQAMPEGHSAGERIEHLERRIKAYALWGSACRVAGQLEPAERRFRTAFLLCRKRRGTQAIRAELYWRWAALKSSQKQFEVALQLVDESVRIFKAEGDHQGEGTALATRGAIHAAARRFSDAVSTLSQVLSRFKLQPRAECSATHTLAYAVCQAEEPDLEAALLRLHRARQLLGPRRSVQKARIYWIEGTIFLRRGSAFAERGERRYLKALQGFQKFQAPYEIALVSLDLSALYRFQKRWGELGELAADTYRRFRELREDKEALAALKLWNDAARARTLSEEILSDVKARLEARAQRHPAAGARGRSRARRLRLS